MPIGQHLQGSAEVVPGQRASGKTYQSHQKTSYFLVRGAKWEFSKKTWSRACSNSSLISLTCLNVGSVLESAARSFSSTSGRSARSLNTLSTTTFSRTPTWHLSRENTKSFDETDRFFHWRAGQERLPQSPADVGR